MISEKEFQARILKLHSKILSKTKKASYSAFEVAGSKLHFVRDETGAQWVLDTSVLFDVYSKHSFINTTVVKAATNGLVNSPSVAVLMAINCIDKNGNRLNS